MIFIGSAAVRRPLAGVFARESYPFPPEVVGFPAFRRTFTHISLVWGLVLLARAAFRMVVLSWRDVDLFVAIHIATGMPLTSVLMAWSFWYARRGLR